MSKNLYVCLSLLLMTMAVSACTNTFHGAGRDIENMGEWVQDTF